ncbi:Gfo/Idh/MocA family protein [Jeotgalibacillus terrae]|uniref:Gfo/Idh/MocA family protein n=1 Tax=Jeotgalibacillus terrae TaxID=587735 RepID=A0ABW5ZLA6_9BACL|nr:Gfo/Idh/MocA family oxidoreductase [Jeotgalibacillus terrae]MBM7579634.1 putative dehydrogenase [Jeotgalibacillus terrae]
MGKKLQFGMVGAGAIAGVHLETFSHFGEQVSFHGITDVYRPLAEKRAEEYEIPNVYEDVEELINDSQIDAVVLGIPNKLHAIYAVKALDAGKHVLIEKPMGINSEEAKMIVRAQRRSGKVAMVGHQMRWQWHIQQAKQQIEKGALGHIYHAKAGWYRRKGIPGWGSWFTQKSESGGGPLIDIGVHMLDLSLFLMGNPKPVTVTGATFAEFGPKKKGIGTWGTPNWNGTFDVEDLATALIKMENGSTLTLEVSWAVHQNTTNDPFIDLMGSEAGVSISGDHAKILTEQFDRPVDIELTSTGKEVDERVKLSEHFIQCILEDKEPFPSVMTGLTNNLILDAIYESSRTGREVVLDWKI